MQNNTVQYIINEQTSVVVYEGETRIYAKDSVMYGKIKDLVARKDEEGLAELVFGLKKKIEKIYEGFQVENDIVFINGKVLPSYLGQRLKGFADAGADY